MKKIFFFCMFIATTLMGVAQNKAQIATDIRYTMDDFTSDLNFIHEDKEYVADKVSSMAKTYGSSTYFIYNGQQMPSFHRWLKDYCTELLRMGEVNHIFAIKEPSIRKLDPESSEDQRYIFEGNLSRKVEGRPMQEHTLSMVVTWNGEGNYVTILQIDEVKDESSLSRKAVFGWVEGAPRDFNIQITKTWMENQNMLVEMKVENTGTVDVLLDQFPHGSGFVAYDDQGNQYGRIQIAIGNNSWMGAGLGAGNSKRTLMAGVPIKARIIIYNLASDATRIARMDWHFYCKEWGIEVGKPIKFRNIIVNRK